MRGRYFFFCSSLPKVKITGPTIDTPKGRIGVVSARAFS
jgi:hypothetical protein